MSALSGSVLPVADWVRSVRAEFPLLSRQVNGQPLIYFDNAATTQKPRAVLEALQRFYQHENANIHRGVHTLSQLATDAFEAAREKVRAFLNAERSEEILFVRGATEAINLVAYGFAQTQLSAGDEIVLSALEHHANIVPWQLHAVARGAVLRIVPIDAHGDLDLEAYEALLGPRTRLVAISHASNALGTINPVESIVASARARGIPVLLDGAQAAPHLPIDVRALGCDFYAFSSHKVFGPTGLGVLYMRAPWLEKLPPLLGGGDMIETVTFERSTFQKAPNKFEAGTPHIAGAVGLGAALDFLQTLGWEAIRAQEEALFDHANRRLSAIDGVERVGTARRKVPVFSFKVAGAHPHDVGTVLDREGLALRAGHHCAQPLMRQLRLPGTTRASLAFYNTLEEIDALAEALPKIVKLFA